MRKFESKPVERDVLVGVVCDRCGASLLSVEGGAKFVAGGAVVASFGYGSRFDLDRWEFDLCDSCAEGLREFIVGGPTTNGDVYCRACHRIHTPPECLLGERVTEG